VVISLFTAKPVNLPFFKGRPDCTRITADSRLPHGSTTDTIPFLTREFSLTVREAVALMGKSGLPATTS